MENWRGGLRTSWYSSDRGSGTSALLIWTNQPIHLFLVGCLNPCIQETNVQVVSPPAPTFDHIEIGSSFLYIFSYAIEQTARIPGKLDVVDHFARFEVQPYPEPHHRLVFNLHINNVIKLRARCCFFSSRHGLPVGWLRLRRHVEISKVGWMGRYDPSLTRVK